MPTSRDDHGFGVFVQVLFSTVGLLSALVMPHETGSVVYYAVTISRPWGDVVLWVLGIASLLYLLDAVLYQMWRVRWPPARFVRRSRHTFGVIIAACWFALVYQGWTQFDTSPLGSLLAVLGLFLLFSLGMDALNEGAKRRRHAEGA